MRRRNAAGERIRVDGQRMNDDECCCGEACGDCDGGTMPSTITVTIAGFANTPWTALNGTHVIPASAECQYLQERDTDGCGFGASVGDCIRVFVGTNLTVRIAGVYFTVAGGFPFSLYGAWVFAKAATGCTGTHTLTLTQAQNTSSAADDCFAAASGSATQFRDCTNTLQTETPTCQVTF